MARPKVQQWPRIRKRSNPGGTVSYLVDLSTATTRERKFFKTRDDAETFAEQRRIERTNHGTASLSLSDDLRREAIDLSQRLRLVGHSLTSAVEFFFKHARPASQQKLIREVIDELQAKRLQAGRVPEYLRIQASVLGNFAKTFGERPIHTVLSRDIEEWITSNAHWSPETRRNYLKDLRSLWNYALKNNYVPENPVDRLERPTVPSTPPGILTPSQAKSLLAEAAKVKGEASMLPYVAIGMFCGLRSAELVRLDWKEIDLKTRLVEVTAAKAKTRQRRHVRIPANLAAWLKPYAKPSGRVTPADRPEGALGRLADKAKIAPWPKNALRHSFASYHLAHHKDASKTALEMGHNSQKLLFASYRELVKPKQAAEYWKIVPAS